MSERCQSCPAEVVFATSAKVRPDHTQATMILDAKPEKRIVLRLASLEGVKHDCGQEACDLVEHQGIRAFVVDVYLDHHATCPKAQQWKGRRR